MDWENLKIKMNEILLFIIIVLLIAFIFYNERQREKSLRDILLAKLSKDAGEFKFATEEVKAGSVEKEVVEIPLEDMSAEEMLGVLKK